MRPEGAGPLGEAVLQTLALAVGGAVAVGALLALALVAAYQRAAPGQALVIRRRGRPAQVSFKGGLALPLVHTVQRVPIAAQALQIECAGREALRCADHVRAQVRATFSLRVQARPEAVLQMAQLLVRTEGGAPQLFAALFTRPCVEALQAVAGRHSFERLRARPQILRRQVAEVVGRRLDGYVLEALQIDGWTRAPDL